MISHAGKAALITGGSRGIGAAAVKMFAQAGADVVFNFHERSDAARQVEEEARKHGTRVESFRADLSKMEPARKLVEFRTSVWAVWTSWSPTRVSGTWRICRSGQ